MRGGRYQTRGLHRRLARAPPKEEIKGGVESQSGGYLVRNAGSVPAMTESDTDTLSDSGAAPLYLTLVGNAGCSAALIIPYSPMAHTTQHRQREASAHMALCWSADALLVAQFDQDREASSKTVAWRTKILRSRWLLIDGLGNGNWSEAAGARLLELLEIRTAGMRPTIITSPWTPEQWRTMPAGDATPETMEAIAGRLDDWFTHASL